MKVVSLFAGCGGLDLGFEKAGFDVIWANEFDKSIHATYALNHPNTKLCTSDIRDLASKDIPDCDGIIGGPPCQSWSEGGKQRGIEDPRGQLFLDYIRIVSEKKPKFFLIENVQGILEEKHKKALDGFLSLLKSAGYNVTFELLNAADYKVPQDRFRVFFIGIRNDLKNKFTFPQAVCSEPITLRKAIGDIVETPRFYCNESVLSEHPTRLNHDVYTGSYDQKYMSRNRVRSWDEPSFTMQAQARNAPQHPQAPKMPFLSSGDRCFAKGYEHLYRRLSVRECARIQTFPDSFHFVYEDVRDGYKMVGNAVPPRLAWYLAEQLKAAFEQPIIRNKTEIPKQSIIEEINVSGLIEKYHVTIIENTAAPIINDGTDIDKTKNVLISLIPSDCNLQYEDHAGRIYYTGKKFPSTIALNELYYFMPYIKGKGIKDLYFIKIARLGSKQEICPQSQDNDVRLVFDLVFVKQLFTDYFPIHLNIWHTFTDTKISKLYRMSEAIETDEEDIHI